MLDSNMVLCISDAEQKSEVLSKLSEFNRNVLKISNSADSSLQVNYNIQNGGVVIAGINANLYFLKSVLHVDHLFVSAEYRGCGLGRVLLAKVEQVAKEHGVHIAHLDTFDWQGKNFYLQNGYEIFGVLDDCPKGHQRYYMKKVLL